MSQVPNSGKVKWRNDRTQQQGGSVAQDHAIVLEEEAEAAEVEVRGTVAWDVSIRVRNHDGSLVRYMWIAVGTRAGFDALL